MHRDFPVSMCFLRRKETHMPTYNRFFANEITVRVRSDMVVLSLSSLENAPRGFCNVLPIRSWEAFFCRKKDRRRNSTKAPTENFVEHHEDNHDQGTTQRIRTTMPTKTLPTTQTSVERKNCQKPAQRSRMFGTQTSVG